jgi:hypothetical protein
MMPLENEKVAAPWTGRREWIEDQPAPESDRVALSGTADDIALDATGVYS